MKSEEIGQLTDTFEGHAQQTENEVEYWLARDLQHLLGYTEWRNFTAVIYKAKTACEVSGHAIPDHFVDVNKTIDLKPAVSGKSTTRLASFHDVRVLMLRDCSSAPKGQP